MLTGGTELVEFRQFVVIYICVTAICADHSAYTKYLVLYLVQVVGSLIWCLWLTVKSKTGG